MVMPAVISLSKIENLKAIHNTESEEVAEESAVISLSKIENLKAIHNSAKYSCVVSVLLSVCQR